MIHRIREAQPASRRLTLLLTSGTLVLQIACAGESPKPDPEGKSPKGPPQVELTQAAVTAAGIKTEPVSLRPVDEILSLTGTLSYDENKVAHVAPRTGGHITRILADFGQRVRAGQPLAEIDSPEVGQALAEWRKSQSFFSVRQRDYDRAKNLLEGKAISQGEFLSREGDFLTAKAEVESADNRLHLLGVSHDEAAKLTEREEVESVFLLRSPIVGKVIDRQINPGEVVEAGKELFTIGDLENLWLLIRLYEKDLRHVKSGQTVEVFTDALPNELSQGKIDYVGDQVDKDTRTVRARAVIHNPEGRLKPGMFVQARLVSQRVSLFQSFPSRRFKRSMESRPSSWRALTMVFAVLLVGIGIYSLGKLPIDAVPDVTPNQVQVLTTAPALLEIEKFLTFPVEAAMSGIPGLTKIRSVSRFGLSAVTLYLPKRALASRRLAGSSERRRAMSFKCEEVFELPSTPHSGKTLAATESALPRERLLAHGLRLKYLTVGWNIIEGIVAAAAAVPAVPLQRDPDLRALTGDDLP